MFSDLLGLSKPPALQDQQAGMPQFPGLSLDQEVAAASQFSQCSPSYTL